MTQVEYAVRRARDTDLPRLAPLWERLAAFEAGLEPRFQVKPDAVKWWLAELTADREARRADVFLAERDGEVAAFLHVRATRGAPFHAADRLGFVDAVWVEPAHRQRGLAKRLLAEAERWCRARGLTHLEAGVVTANADAVAAWARLGFRTTASTVTRALTGDARKDVARAFDAQAPRVAASPYFAFGERVRRLVEFARPNPMHRVLDVGCGTGTVLAALRDRTGLRVGVEVSREMARRARESADADVVLADADHLPFKPGAFHRVIARALLHHLPDPVAGVAEMARVTAPGGAVVAEDIVTSEDAARADRHNELEHLRDPAHVRMLPASAVKALVEKGGLAAEESTSFKEIRVLDEWLAITAPRDEDASRLRELARKYAARAEFDETGLGLRFAGNEVRFDHTHVLVRARKPEK